MGKLEAYFYEHILLPLVRYNEIKHDGEIGSDRDLRAAIDVATSLYHLREHIPAQHRKSRNEIVAECADYGLLGDVVNAAKHGELNRGTPLIDSADAIRQVHVVTTFSDERGTYVHEEKQVVVTLSDGSERDLFDVMISVHNFWLHELKSIGAKPANKTFSNPTTGLVSRDDAKQLRLQIIQGIRWHHSFRLQQYNYEKSLIEPVDLTDAQDIVFSLRMPPSFDIELRSSAGVLLSRKLQLTLEQSQHLDTIEGEKERNAYLLHLAMEQGIHDQLLSEYSKSRADNEM